MNKILIFILMLGLLTIYGCASFSELTGFAASKMTFRQGVKKISEIDEKQLKAKLKGEPIKTELGETVVKAVTMYKYKLEKTKEGYKVTVSLDI